MYAIHSPPLAGDPARAFDRARFVKMGFSGWGLVLGPFWLLAQRLWRPFGVWAVGALAVGVAEAGGWLAPAGGSALYLVTAFWIGVEGRAWLSRKLERSGLPLFDLVEARDDDAAARKFLERTLTASPPPAPARPAGRAPESNMVLGLFPEAQGK